MATVAAIFTAASCCTLARLSAGHLTPLVDPAVRVFVTGGAYCVAHQHTGLLNHLCSRGCGGVSPAGTVLRRQGIGR